MSTAFDFCIPTRGTKVPHTPDWIHEIKNDGYRLRLERDGDRVRLITRNGYDWTKRYPWIVESALKNRVKQFVINGEAVILGKPPRLRRMPRPSAEPQRRACA
jgi:bifunctional non-homologous end joining protein LigD